MDLSHYGVPALEPTEEKAEAVAGTGSSEQANCQLTEHKDE